MRRFIFVIMSIALTIPSFYNSSPVKKLATEEAVLYQKSPLVAYGEALYESESCSSCHTLQIENESSHLISLDGGGHKYPSGWLYEYFNMPQRLMPESKKRRYLEFYNNPLDHEFIAVKQKSKAWKQLMKEADIVQKDLMEVGITADKTEILALLAYIQQIPASEKKMELDSIAEQKILAEQNVWDNLFSDDPNMIIDVANDGSNIENGKIVYNDYCSVCHGRDGRGGVGPNLTDEYWLSGGAKLEIAKAIVYGNPKKGMISWKSILTPQEVGELVAYITSIGGSNPENAKDPQGKKE